MPESPDHSPSADIPLAGLLEIPSHLESLLNDNSETQASNHRSQPYIVCLVLGTAGVQVAFSIQFASGIPYFRSLGISQIAATLAWLIPPLCGSFVQPLFGRWSDDCGRRKPFIVTGSLGIVIALLGYAWSPNLADLLSRVSEGKLSSTVLSQSLVVCFFLCLNVAIQPVQSGLRALMVDKCAASQQAEMTAWASRINFVASMASYLAAASDLAGESPVSTKQLQALVNLSIVVIVISVGVTCCVVSENSLTRPDPPEATEGISKTWKMLSPRLFRIYLVQFFSWFAWFPVLVQITGFIDTLNRASQNPLQSEDMKSESPGAAALFAQACVALVASIMLPRLVQWASVAAANSKHKIISAYVRDTARSELWVLQMLWLTSQVLFSILLSLTFLKHKTLAILAIALSGICWCVTQWVPFVLVNEEVIRIEDRRRHAALDSHTSLLLSAHNTFIASPQILATAVSSGIFEVLKAQSSSDPVDNVLWVFASSILMSVIAALLVTKLLRV